MTPCELREGVAPDRTAHDLTNEILKRELRDDKGVDADGD